MISSGDLYSPSLAFTMPAFSSKFIERVESAALFEIAMISPSFSSSRLFIFLEYAPIGSTCTPTVGTM